MLSATRIVVALVRAIATVIGKRREFDAEMLRFDGLTAEQVDAEVRKAARRFADENAEGR